MNNEHKHQPGAGSLAYVRGSASAYSFTIGSLRCFSEISMMTLSGDASLLLAGRSDGVLCGIVCDRHQNNTLRQPLSTLCSFTTRHSYFLHKDINRMDTSNCYSFIVNLCFVCSDDFFKHPSSGRLRIFTKTS